MAISSGRARPAPVTIGVTAARVKVLALSPAGLRTWAILSHLRDRSARREFGMLRFLLSRVAQTIAVLFTVSVIIFALMRLIPGDPVLMMLGDDFTENAYRQLRAKLGLDRSIVSQYVIWLQAILRGDFGDS